MKVCVALVALAVVVISGPVPEEAVTTDDSPTDYILVETSPGVYAVEDLEDSELDLTASESDVTYHFYSRHNPDDGVDLKNTQVDVLKSTEFAASKDTVFVIHGWKDGHDSTYNRQMREVVLAVHDINVFIVDWAPIAGKNYISARYAVEKVGNYIGSFIQSLVSTYGVDVSKISLIGHSLGAHIAGNTGVALNGQVGSIVGLDPAGPLFFKSSKDRLTEKSGKFVQAIHTNSRLLGIQHLSGHADYYPNGGASQPGCILDIAGACAHARSFQYYAESVLSSGQGFVAAQCSSYSRYNSGKCSTSSVSYMGGFNIDNGASGEYYLKTNSRSPFALG